MTAAIRFDAIERAYGAQPVLRGVSFEVKAGEYLGLVGVNGAGKTTLIKGLLDLGDIDNGSIEIHGISHRLPASRARRSLISGVRDGERMISKRSCTAELTLLTFCPPGPDARM